MSYRQNNSSPQIFSEIIEAPLLIETQPKRTISAKGKDQNKGIHEMLHHLNSDQLVQGILLSEILGKPLSQRRLHHRY